MNELSQYVAVIGVIAIGLVAAAGVITDIDRRRRAQRTSKEIQAHQTSADDAVMETLKRVTEQLRSSTPTTGSSTELRKLIGVLEARIKAIEDRLPDSETLDKIASVNDAILATKLEEVDRTLIRLEQNQMSTGRVFGLISAFLGVLFALAALIPWIVERIVTALQ